MKITYSAVKHTYRVNTGNTECGLRSTLFYTLIPFLQPLFKISRDFSGKKIRGERKTTTMITWFLDSVNIILCCLFLLQFVILVLCCLFLLLLYFMFLLLVVIDTDLPATKTRRPGSDSYPITLPSLQKIRLHSVSPK
jgi:hypothetical protein